MSRSAGCAVFLEPYLGGLREPVVGFPAPRWFKEAVGGLLSQSSESLRLLGNCLLPRPCMRRDGALLLMVRGEGVTPWGLELSVDVVSQWQVRLWANGACYGSMGHAMVWCFFGVCVMMPSVLL
jgi:hypothetical protein